MVDRREFLSLCTRSACAAALGGGLLGRLGVAPVLGQTRTLARNHTLPVWIGDVVGDGVFGDHDLAAVAAALAGERGIGLMPAASFDYRADVLAQGRIDDVALEAVMATHERLLHSPGDLRPRPVTVAWHYGWYNHPGRKPRQHHVWFRGGAYSSREPAAEATFNDLKNEFGVTVDALSWADPDRDGSLNDNLEQGYFRATNAATRQTALLYESLISLGQKRRQPRIDFSKRKVRKRLERNFEQMAEFLVRAQDAGVRNFLLDGRPVIFLYGSHVWGLDPMSPGEQNRLVDRAVENAIAAFAAVYGTAPFLIGEEFTFVQSDRFDGAHQRRAVNFDGVFTYHHAATSELRENGGGRLAGDYVAAVKEIYRHTYDGIAGLRNRFTNRKVIAVPSLAAGFSKAGETTLFASREEHVAFLHEMLEHHEERFMVPAWGRGALETTPAIVSVGSWNEEWEGHAVMPAEFNRSLDPYVDGFDYASSIKQVFGWNHYATRAPNPLP